MKKISEKEFAFVAKEKLNEKEKELEKLKNEREHLLARYKKSSESEKEQIEREMQICAMKIENLCLGIKQLCKKIVLAIKSIKK